MEYLLDFARRRPGDNSPRPRGARIAPAPMAADATRVAPAAAQAGGDRARRRAGQRANEALGERMDAARQRPRLETIVPADAAGVNLPPPPSAPTLSADRTPETVRAARAIDAGRATESAERWESIPAPARLAVSAGKGVVDAATLGLADDAAARITEALERVTGRPVADPYAAFEALDRSAAERVAGLAGFAAGAGGVIGVQNALLRRAGVPGFTPGAMTPGKELARNAAETIPFDLAYDADSAGERLGNAALGLAGAAGLTALSRSAPKVSDDVVVPSDAAPRPRPAPSPPPSVLANEAGAAPREVVRTVAGAGAGGAVGAAVDDEDPLRGGLAGAALGAGVANAPALAKRVRAGTGSAPMTTDVPPLTDDQLREIIAPPRPEAVNESLEQAARAGVREMEGPPRAEIDADEFVNVSKFDLDDPAAADRLRDEVRRVVSAQGLAPKEVVPWSETIKQARGIAKSIGLEDADFDAQKVIRNRLSGPEMLAIRNVVSGNIDELEQVSRQLESGRGPDGTPLSAEEIQNTALRRARLESTNDRLLDSFIRARSQTGRDLNNLKILAARSLDPVVWTAKGQQVAGAPLSDLVKADIRRLVNAGDRKDLIAYVAGLRKAKASEKGTTLWKAGLLTSPTTDAANLIGNTMMSVLETVKDPIAFVFDRLLSASTGVTTKAAPSLGSLASQGRAALRGAREGAEMMGLGEGVRALRAGEGVVEAARRTGERIRKADITDAEMQKLDFRHVNFDNAFADIYTKGVFKRLSAEDRVFRHAAMARSLDEQARVLARREGVRGEAFTARVRELVERPSDEMTLKAIAEAEYVTFQNRGALARTLSAGKREAGVVGEVVLPFTTTPANVAQRVLDYSPVGALRGAYDVVRLVRKVVEPAKIPETQKRAVEAMARGLVGYNGTPVSLMGLGYWLADQGLMTGDFPDDGAERGAWEIEGKQPNAVLMDGAWHSLERLSPVGQLLVVGAQFHEALRQPGVPLSGRLAGGVASAATTVLEMSPLQGVEGALEAVKDPLGQGGNYLEGLAGSVVPAVVARSAKIGDDRARVGEGVTGRLRSRIPGLRGDLPARVDGFGREVEADPGVAANLLNPLASREDEREADPVVREMARIGAGITTLSRWEDEDDESYRRRQVVYGETIREELEALFANPDYQGADDVLKTEVVESLISDVRSQITRELRRAN